MTPTQFDAIVTRLDAILAAVSGANQPAPEPFSELPEVLPPLPPGTRYGGQLKDYEGILAGWIYDASDCEDQWTYGTRWQGRKDMTYVASANWHIAI